MKCRAATAYASRYRAETRIWNWTVGPKHPDIAVKRFRCVIWPMANGFKPAWKARAESKLGIIHDIIHVAFAA